MSLLQSLASQQWTLLTPIKKRERFKIKRVQRKCWNAASEVKQTPQEINIREPQFMTSQYETVGKKKPKYLLRQIEESSTA